MVELRPSALAMGRPQHLRGEQQAGRGGRSSVSSSPPLILALIPRYQPLGLLVQFTFLMLLCARSYGGWGALGAGRYQLSPNAWWRSGAELGTISSRAGCPQAEKGRVDCWCPATSSSAGQPVPRRKSCGRRRDILSRPHNLDPTVKMAIFAKNRLAERQAEHLDLI